MANTTPNVTVDGGAFGDIRFHMLTAGLGLSKVADAVGRHAWLTQLCKGQLSDVATRAMVDMHLGAGGAEALVAVGLAAELEDGRIHVTSATEEVEAWRAYLEKCSRGGKNRAARDRERADNDPKQDLSPAVAQPEPDSSPAKPAAKPGSTRSQVSGSGSGPSSGNTESEKPPKPPKGGSPRSRSKGISQLERAAAGAVLAKLTVRTGIPYRCSDAHAALIVARYRGGFDEVDLRKVIGYAASSAQEGGLGWQEDERMQHFLRPETLFGPKTIEKYIDAARAWFSKRGLAVPEPSPEFEAWRVAEAGAPLLQVVR